MPSINFQKQFVPLIESGQKRQTIRPMRKNPFKQGDRLYLFTGLRTKNCRTLITPESYIYMYGLLEYVKGYDYKALKSGKFPSGKRPYVICKSVENIYIRENMIWEGSYFVYINDKDIQRGFECYDKFAKADGFNSFEEFINFFKNQYGLPFEGVLIKW